MIAGCESSPPVGSNCLPVANMNPQSTPSTPPAIDVATATRKPMWGTPSRMWRARIAIQTKKAAITSVEMIPIVGRNSLYVNVKATTYNPKATIAAHIIIRTRETALSSRTSSPNSHKEAANTDSVSHPSVPLCTCPSSR